MNAHKISSANSYFDGNFHSTKLSSTVVTLLGTNNDSRSYRNGPLKRKRLQMIFFSSTISSYYIQNMNYVVSFDDEKRQQWMIYVKK